MWAYVALCSYRISTNKNVIAYQLQAVHLMSTRMSPSTNKFRAFSLAMSE